MLWGEFRSIFSEDFSETHSQTLLLPFWKPFSRQETRLKSDPPRKKFNIKIDDSRNENIGLDDEGNMIERKQKKEEEKKW